MYAYRQDSIRMCMCDMIGSKLFIFNIELAADGIL